MILLTGVTGKSGRWFLNSLKTSGHLNHRYRAIVRPTSNVDIIRGSGLPMELVYGNLYDERFLADAMQGITKVFHIAGIHTSLQVVRSAAKAGVEWMVLVHTTGIYSRYKAAGKEYRQIEQRVEELAKTAEISLTILRPTMIYGSVNDRNVAVFISMVDRLRLFPVVNQGKYPLQPVHEKDLGEAYYQVLRSEQITRGKNYILSGKEPILLVDMLKTIGRKLNKKNIFISVPYPIAYAGATLLHLASLGRVDFRERVQRLVEPRIFSHDEAHRDFGFTPMSFEDGIVNEIVEYSQKRAA